LILYVVRIIEDNDQ